MADEQVVAPDPGQATPAPTGDVGQAEPFFTSGEDVFNTREDLERAWKDSYQRRDDYTRKTQAVAQLRKTYEQRQKEFEQRQKEFEEKQKEYEKYDRMLQTRPDVYQKLRQALNQPPDANVAFQRAESLVNDKTGELEQRLKEFEEWKQQQELEREKQNVFQQLSQELPDFNPETIEERLARLQNASFGDLARLLYHADRGEKSPLQVEQEITDKLKKKGGVKTASPQGGKPPEGQGFKSLDEARHAALRDAQGG